MFFCPPPSTWGWQCRGFERCRVTGLRANRCASNVSARQTAAPCHGYNNRKGSALSCTSPSRGTGGGGIKCVWTVRQRNATASADGALWKAEEKVKKVRERKENANIWGGFVFLPIVQIGRSHSTAAAGACNSPQDPKDGFICIKYSCPHNTDFFKWGKRQN